MADLILSWPSWLRLLIALLLYCGISMFVVWRFHDRIVALGNSDPWPYEPRTADEKTAEEESSTTPIPPEASSLGQRVGQWVGMAFVFLLAFTVSNLWSNAEQARSYTKSEAFSFESASALAAQLPPDAGGTIVVDGLREYAATMAGQWPLLRAADAAGATAVQRQAGQDLVVAMRQAATAGADKSPLWDNLSSDTTDLVQNGVDRLDVIPSGQVPGMMGVLFVLGLITLALAAAFQAGPLPSNVVLIGLMAAVVALLTFFVSDISNPFQTGVGVVSGIG